MITHRPVRSLLAGLLAVALLLIIGLHFFAGPSQKTSGKIRIGIPDDLSGLVLEYLIKEKGVAGARGGLRPPFPERLLWQ